MVVSDFAVRPRIPPGLRAPMNRAGKDTQMDEKTHKRLIRMKLPAELVDALDEMCHYVHPVNEQKLRSRTLHNMIECSLMYAVWKWSHGQGPDEELKGRYPDWNENLHRVRAAALGEARTGWLN